MFSWLIQLVKLTFLLLNTNVTLCNIFDICKAHSHVVPLPEAEVLLDNRDRFLVHYNALAKLSAERLLLNYNVVFKHHHFWHICYNARFTNPTAVWCFEFEDFVGLMIKCAKEANVTDADLKFYSLLDGTCP